MQGLLQKQSLVLPLFEVMRYRSENQGLRTTLVDRRRL